MAIQLPRVLKNLNLFIDGRGYAGRVDQITLPTLTLVTEEHRAGGMDAPVDLDMGMEVLRSTFTLSDFDEEVYALFGRLDAEAVPFSVRGALQAQGQETTPVIAQMRGGVRELDPGDWAPGTKNTLTCEATLSYFRLTIGAREVVEVDVPNMVRIVDGFDQLAGQRLALGL
jgi:uncharacterized protein